MKLDYTKDAFTRMKGRFLLEAMYHEELEKFIEEVSELEYINFSNTGMKIWGANRLRRIITSVSLKINDSKHYKILIYKGEK